MINRLCIIGVGLIGGSLACALKKAGAVGEVVGYGRQLANLEAGVELGVIDRYETELSEAVSGCDVVVLAVPVGSMGPLFKALAPLLEPGAVLTDVGSTKASVVAAAVEAFGAIPPQFVPGHPIAGTEKSGVTAAFDSLYVGRRVLLTPLEQTRPEAVASITRMWEAAGAEVEVMSVAHHDEVLAATSHLPHVLAFALVDALAKLDEKAEVFRYAAGGFRDFTRIASSDPTMWSDICAANSSALQSALGHFRQALDELSAAIEANDRNKLFTIFERAKRARDAFCEALDYANE